MADGEKSSWWKQWGPAVLAAAGAGSSAAARVFGLGVDYAVVIGYVGALLAVAAVAYMPSRVTRRSPQIVDERGKPAELPIIPPGVKRYATWVMYALIIPIGPLWLLWPSICPFAQLSDFVGSTLVGGQGDVFMHHAPRVVRTPGGEQYQAFRAVSLTITKMTSTAMRVKSVRVHSKPLDVIPSVPVFGKSPKNVTGLNCFHATVPAGGGVTTALMVKDDHLIGGSILLDREHPFALLNIDLDGEQAGYHVLAVEVELCDGSNNRKRILHTTNSVVVNGPPEADR